MFVLVVNAGSSSVKYQLYNDTGDVLAKGLCERIGIDGSRIVHKVPGKADYINVSEMATHTEAVQAMVDALISPEHGVVKSLDEISAIGHRIVHGGPYFTESVLVTNEVIANLELCRDIAPLHTGPHLMGIRGCLTVMPSTPQVLVFDTAFHQTMPEQAYFYPIPYELYRKYKIRRYGFHGTSHKYVSEQAIKFLGKPAADTKIITCHLGNGSSITAVQGGKCMDTSMGFTPLEGVIMGSRCGSIDPAIVPFIMEKENIQPSEMQAWMNKNCGLLGVSEVSSDLREVEEQSHKGNEQAHLAHNILCYGIKKYIGSYTAVMDGVDAIVFTAGIGENNSEVRSDTMRGMSYLGIKIDEKKNANLKNTGDPVVISTPDSKVIVMVIPTNEELVIANDTKEIVSKL